MDSQITLLPFTNRNLRGLPASLWRLVINDPRIRHDFPQVWARYNTPSLAEQSVAEVCDNMVRRRGMFGAYAVLYCGKPIGVATYEQEELLSGAWYRKKPLACGPKLAIWIGSTDLVSREAGLLSIIMSRAAHALAYMGWLSGKPWTIVRPDHSHVLRCLSVAAEFGYFQPVGGPADYRSVDTVTIPRQLWVAGRDVRNLLLSAE